MASPRAKFSLNKALSQSWEISKQNFWFLVGITVIFLVLSSVPSLLDILPGYIRSYNSLIALLIVPISATGLFLIGQNLLRKQPATVATFFSGFRFYWRAMGLIILTAVIVIAGLILFIIPGIYLGIRYSQALYILIDQDVSITEAMRRSSRLAEDNIWSLFGSRLVIAVVGLIGFILLGIGILWTLPIAILAQISIYLQLRDSIKTEENHSSEKTSTQEPITTTS